MQIKLMLDIVRVIAIIAHAIVLDVLAIAEDVHVIVIDVHANVQMLLMHNKKRIGYSYSLEFYL